jgi:hypothetical protein
MRLDGKQAVQLLVNQSNRIEAFEVVSQLQTGETDENLRKYLHLYLHGLFEKDPNAGKEYHGLQVYLQLFCGLMSPSYPISVSTHR